MKRQRQTICLNMIVKNEAHIILRCLESVRPIIDHWVIVDTGSTDGTQDVIREFYHDIPGTLHERPWVNFAHNRTEALEYAYRKTDYLFIIDADEILRFDPDYTRPALSADAYNIEIVDVYSVETPGDGKLSYHRKQLIRNTLKWRYVGVLHEYIQCDEAKSEQHLTGVRIHRFPDGARARNPLTYRRDAEILENALIDEPDNSRYVFYLAQSYRDCGQLDKALMNYERRAKMGGWIEEVGYSLYQVAVLKARRGASWGEVLEAYLAAYQGNPSRAEPLFHAGQHYLKEKKYHAAHVFFSRAMAIAKPSPSALFVELPIYDYLVPFKYAATCFYAGDHAAGIRTNNELLAGDKLPPAKREQAIKNRRFSLDVLTRSQETGARPEGDVRVIVPLREPSTALDDCVAGLLEQSYTDFKVLFVDDGSVNGAGSRLPLGDQRFALLSFDRLRSWDALLLDVLRDQTRPEDLVVILPPDVALATPQTLETALAHLDHDGCWLLYGQHRLDSGDAGIALPPAEPADLETFGADLVSRSAVFFRARLSRGYTAREEPADLRSRAFADHLLKVAGFEHIRFLDDELTRVSTIAGGLEQ